ELKQLLAGCHPSASKLIEEESKTTQGFMTVLATQVGWMETLARAWPSSHESSFSISEWIAGTTSIDSVIIANDPRYSAISGPLCNAFVSLATRQLLAMPDCDERRIWFCLDELGNLPKCPSLLKLLTLGRSKGARTIAGVQSVSQLRS